MTYEDRQKAFEKELLELVQKHKVNVYAANVVFPNGEVMPMLKTSDADAKLEDQIKEVETDEDKSKK